jgi:hypothetical protein
MMMMMAPEGFREFAEASHAVIPYCVWSQEY